MKKAIAFQILILFIGVLVYTPALTVAVEKVDYQQETISHNSQVNYEHAADTQKKKKSDPYVYITKTGKKYHREDCSYLRKSKIKTKLSEAKRRGYKACSRCNPPK